MTDLSESINSKKINFAILLVRFWLGSVMLKHSGSYLLQGKVPELAAFLESLDWPIPLVLAYASQFVEFFAAILILTGVRFGAWLMAFTLGIAVIFAHSGKIYSEAELPFNYFLMSLVLGLVGLGKPSIESFFSKKHFSKNNRP